MPLDHSLLIVEQDRELLDSLHRAFIEQGYLVTAVHHPRQALEAATFKHFDVAIVDLSLPYLDGMQLTRRLQRLVANLRVVLLVDELEEPHDAQADQCDAWEMVERNGCRDKLIVATQRALESLARADSPSPALVES